LCRAVRQQFGATPLSDRRSSGDGGRGNENAEGRAVAEFALDLRPAAVGLGDVFRDGEPKTGDALLARTRAVQLENRSKIRAQASGAMPGPSPQT